MLWIGNNSSLVSGGARQKNLGWPVGRHQNKLKYIIKLIQAQEVSKDLDFFF
jgi:hypothetical protein